MPTKRDKLNDALVVWSIPFDPGGERGFPERGGQGGAAGRGAQAVVMTTPEHDGSAENHRASDPAKAVRTRPARF